MKARASIALLGCLVLLLLIAFAPISNAATPGSLSVSPTAGPVGAKMAITGKGFPANANLALQWASTNVTWVLSGNPTEISDIKTVPLQVSLGSVSTDSSGSFSTTAQVPTDYGGKHFIQAFDTSGTAIPGQAIYTLEPSFSISTTRGPAGTPITVRATGLSYGLYSTNYHLMWDNQDFGYMTAVTTHGVANATFYAVGDVGVHYIDVYQGYPGAAYLNPQENPSPGNWFPPLLPYHATFTITSDVYSQGLGGADILALMSLALVLAAFAFTPILALKSRRRGFPMGPTHTRGRVGVTRVMGVALVAVALILGGGALFLSQSQGNSNPQPSTTAGGVTQTVTSVSTVTTTTTTTMTTSASASKQQVVTPFTPQVVVVRPLIKVPQSTATAGPRITVTPNLATVGTDITVNGAGFPPNSNVPVSWSSRQGNNLNGFKLVSVPLRNVTTGADGSFALNTKVPYDLEGIHFISVGNLTRNSNATLYVERSATISASSGPQGSTIVIKMTGVGWSYLTNIAVLDYDNSYVGYGCGFNSQGNVTFTLTAAGAPGVHSIDIYPSIYLGPQSPATPAIFRYPLMTPYDHPGLSPSFHFSYVVTGTTQPQGLGNADPSLVAALSIAMSSLFLAIEFSGRFRLFRLSWD